MAFDGALVSRALNYSLLDSNGNSARIWDLAIDMAEADYPPLLAVLFRSPSHGNEVRSVPARDVRWDWAKQQAETAGLEASTEISEEELEQGVLLKRDVLDALLLDVENRQATRANDLWLRQQDGSVVLAGADASLWGLIRRVFRGHVRSGRQARMLDWKQVEFLRGDPEAARRGRDYHHRVDRLAPPEVARLADAIPYLHAAELLTLISDPRAADTLEAMSPERQTQVFEELPEDQAVRLLSLMAPDAVADLLGRLSPAMAEHFIDLLPPAKSDKVVELLRYPDDSVGGLMTNDVVFAAADLTVKAARELLRERLKEPDFVAYIYVVENDENQALCGVITLRDFVIAQDEQRLEDIMVRRVASLEPLQPAKAAARRLLDSHISALPVVGNDRRLLGAVTIDAAVAQLAPAEWREQAPTVFS